MLFFQTRIYRGSMSMPMPKPRGFRQDGSLYYSKNFSKKKLFRWKRYCLTLDAWTEFCVFLKEVFNNYYLHSETVDLFAHLMGNNLFYLCRQCYAIIDSNYLGKVSS